MAIKLSIFLKRTQQTIENWLKSNNIKNLQELISHSKFNGLDLDENAKSLALNCFKDKMLNDTQNVESSLNEKVENIQNDIVSKRKSKNKQI